MRLFKILINLVVLSESVKDSRIADSDHAVEIASPIVATLPQGSNNLQHFIAKELNYGEEHGRSTIIACYVLLSAIKKNLVPSANWLNSLSASTNTACITKHI